MPKYDIMFDVDLQPLGASIIKDVLTSVNKAITLAKDLDLSVVGEINPGTGLFEYKIVNEHSEEL